MYCQKKGCTRLGMMVTNTRGQQGRLCAEHMEAWNLLGIDGRQCLDERLLYTETELRTYVETMARGRQPQRPLTEIVRDYVAASAAARTEWHEWLSTPESCAGKEQPCPNPIRT